MNGDKGKSGKLMDLELITVADDNDDEVVRLAAQGDDGAFERLVRRHEEHVSRIMWRFSHDEAIHADLVHEVFVQVYLSLDRFRGDAPFIHWLSALASRTGLRWWRRQSRDASRHRQLPDDMEDVRAKGDEIGAGPLDAVGELQAMLSELNADDRVVLTLMYYEKKNAKEIAALLGWTHTATRMRLSRARKKLQRIAKAHGLSWEE